MSRRTETRTAPTQKPESCMLVKFFQEYCVVPFIARSKFVKTTLSVDSDYQTEIPSLIFKGEVC